MKSALRTTASSISLLLLLFASSFTGRAQFYCYIYDDSSDVAEYRPVAMAPELKIFQLINEIRVANGRKPVSWSEDAAAVARLHSVDMAEHQYFSHLDLDGRLAGARADSLGLSDWRGIGENIAWNKGFDDPATRAVAAWMNSPGHRENILKKSWRETGIGIAIAPDGRYYFTQVFLKRR